MIEWLPVEAVIIIHGEQIGEHGGAPGVRDEGLLRSALARSQNLHAYEPNTGLARLAASYAYGIARNHAFVDGNKRLALAATATFLILNDAPLKASEADAYEFVMGVAEGRYAETDAAAWIRTNL
jgi:death-on-curing protein